jgi:hypothetical protein
MSKILFSKSIVIFTLAGIITACTPPASNSTLSQSVSQKNNSCTITCYEKTPTCYVSQDVSGCLTITNDKPVSNDGARTCVLPACEKNVTYQLRGTSSQPYVAQ